MKRTIYFLLFLIVFTVEACIAIYIHDDFIRPYVGDVLVTILLCCLLRGIFPDRLHRLPLYVFLFSVLIEFTQLLNITEQMGIKNKIIRIFLGTTFDWKDIVCYAIGCILFYIAETTFKKRRLNQSGQQGESE